MGLDLRSNRFSSFKVTAPSGGYTAGQLTRIEDTTCIIVDAADAADEAVAIYKAEKVVVPKSTVTGEAVVAVGDKLYYDAALGAVNTASSGNTLCGRATEAAALADTTVEMDFDGTLA